MAVCLRTFLTSDHQDHYTTICFEGELDDYQIEFDKIENAAAERRRRQNLDDLASELRGDEVGRQQRFLSADARQNLIDKRNGRPSRAMATLEWLLANDPAYAALHKAAASEVRAAQGKAEAFQLKVDGLKLETKREIADMVDNAVTLPDGRKAFLDRNDQAWTLDNDRVNSAITEGIKWTGRPQREEYLERVDRLNQLEAAAHQGRVLSTRLGDIDNKLNDEDEPPSAEAIENYRSEIEAIEAELNASSDELNIKTENTSIENDEAPDIAALNQNAVPTL